MPRKPAQEATEAPVGDNTSTLDALMGAVQDLVQQVGALTTKVVEMEAKSADKPKAKADGKKRRKEK